MPEFDHEAAKEQALMLARHMRDQTGEITNQLACLIMPGGEKEMIATAGVHPSLFWPMLIHHCREKGPIALTITSECWAANFELNSDDPDFQRVQNHEIAIVDLPREKRRELLLVSYQTRTKSYINQAEILDGVVGEWMGWMEPHSGRMMNILAKAFANAS